MILDSFRLLFAVWHRGPGHAVYGPGPAVSCAALVLALVGVWLFVFCLRRGKNGGGIVVFLIVPGMSADIYMYRSMLIIHIGAIALCWFARLYSCFGPC